MHRESFPVNGVFCAQPQKFSPSKVLLYTVSWQYVELMLSILATLKYVHVETRILFLPNPLRIQQSTGIEGCQ